MDTNSNSPTGDQRRDTRLPTNTQLESLPALGQPSSSSPDLGHDDTYASSDGGVMLESADGTLPHSETGNSAEAASTTTGPDAGPAQQMKRKDQSVGAKWKKKGKQAAKAVESGAGGEKKDVHDSSSDQRTQVLAKKMSEWDKLTKGLGKSLSKLQKPWEEDTPYTGRG